MRRVVLVLLLCAFGTVEAVVRLLALTLCVVLIVPVLILADDNNLSRLLTPMLWSSAIKIAETS